MIKIKALEITKLYNFVDDDFFCLKPRGRPCRVPCARREAQRGLGSPNSLVPDPLLRLLHAICPPRLAPTSPPHSPRPRWICRPQVAPGAEAAGCVGYVPGAGGRRPHRS